MSQVLWIREAHDEDAECPDLWALLEFSARLDAICVSKGVRKLSEFHDYSEVAAEFGEELDPNFSSPEELIGVLTVIRDTISEDGDEMSFLKAGEDRLSDLINDLQITMDVAQRCIEKGAQVQLMAVG